MAQVVWLMCKNKDDDYYGDVRTKENWEQLVLDMHDDSEMFDDGKEREEFVAEMKNWTTQDIINYIKGYMTLDLVEITQEEFELYRQGARFIKDISLASCPVESDYGDGDKTWTITDEVARLWEGNDRRTREREYIKTHAVSYNGKDGTFSVQGDDYDVVQAIKEDLHIRYVGERKSHIKVVLEADLDEEQFRENMGMDENFDLYDSIMYALDYGEDDEESLHNAIHIKVERS